MAPGLGCPGPQPVAGTAEEFLIGQTITFLSPFPGILSPKDVVFLCSPVFSRYAQERAAHQAVGK
jgi:hypothetical protein